MISFGRGSSVKAAAVTAPAAQNVMSMKGKSGTSGRRELMEAKMSAVKKTVYAEFIVASNSVVQKGAATDTHGRTTDVHKIHSSATPFTSDETRHADTTATISSDTKKAPKELKRGMAELLEAEQTIKQSLDGLVDSMRGLDPMVP